MAINFPSSPTLNQAYTSGDRTWTWNGRYWKATSTTVGYTGSAGAGGAKGGGSDQIFYENDQTITASYTIPVGKNALTTGPVTISSGTVVTISDGSRWVIV